MMLMLSVLSPQHHCFALTCRGVSGGGLSFRGEKLPLWNCWWSVDQDRPVLCGQWEIPAPADAGAFSMGPQVLPGWRGVAGAWGVSQGW